MSPFTDAPFEIVTKSEAAKRQLATAIRLCLAGGDAVSIRTLVCAAHEILTVLVAPKGGRSLILDNPLYSAEKKKAFGAASRERTTSSSMLTVTLRRACVFDHSS